MLRGTPSTSIGCTPGVHAKPLTRTRPGSRPRARFAASPIPLSKEPADAGGAEPAAGPVVTDALTRLVGADARRADTLRQVDWSWSAQDAGTAEGLPTFCAAHPPCRRSLPPASRRRRAQWGDSSRSRYGARASLPKGKANGRPQPTTLKPGHASAENIGAASASRPDNDRPARHTSWFSSSAVARDAPSVPHFRRVAIQGNTRTHQCFR